MYDLELSSIQFSLLSSTVYLAIYAIMQVPVGFIVDRIGLKKSLLLGSVICAISSIGFAYSYGYVSAAFFRFLTGFGSAFGFICLLVSVYDWLPRKHIALLIGVSQFIGTMGPMLAAGPLEVIAEQGSIDWRMVFISLAIAGFILSIFIAIFVSNNHEKSGHYTILKRPESIFKSLKCLSTKSQAWSIALFSALVYFSLEYLSENEGKIFLISKGFSSTFAAFMITTAWIGYAFGCPLLGWLSDFLSRRKPIMIFSAFSCTLGMTCIVYANHPYIIAIAFFLLGLGAAGQSVAFVMMSEQFKKPYLAASLSMNNAMITMLSAINAPIIGSALEFLKTTTAPQLSDYQIAFSGLAATVGLSIIIAIFLLKETYCKSIADFTILSSRQSHKS
tara:strand:- start:48 stop:1217 length:1170 start_codon:yes stop_codon:yes gene_type:complete